MSVIYQQKIFESDRTLYTIGYGGRRGNSELMQILKLHNVRTLVDVRDTPFSKFDEFSKPTLARVSAEHDIAYRHLDALGNPRHIRKAPGDWRAPYLTYIRHSPNAADAIGVINQVEWPVCLMCAEKSYTECHREITAELIKNRSETPITVIHL